MYQIFVTHVRPIIDFGSVVWNTGYLGDLCMLESVQRRWTKKVEEGVANLPYSERLSRLKLYSINGKLLRADLIQVWKIMSGLSPRLDGLFSRIGIGRTWGHSLKIFVPHHSHCPLTSHDLFLS